MAMRARRAAAWSYRVLFSAQIFAGAAVVMVGAISKADLATGMVVLSAVHLVEPMQWMQGQAWWLLPGLVLLGGVFGLIRRVVGPPWLWDAVHHYLDVFREDAFEIAPEDASHHHRVTLFRYVRWRWTWSKWPWSGWLIPVERSGYTTQESDTAFRAPDHADDVEGVAGMAWARNHIVCIENLPDLTSDVGDKEFAAYSRNTAVPVSWLHERLPKCRALCGIPVEVKSKLWGVLVLDSRSPTGIKSEATSLYRPVSRFLAKLLERV